MNCSYGSSLSLSPQSFVPRRRLLSAGCCWLLVPTIDERDSMRWLRRRVEEKLWKDDWGHKRGWNFRAKKPYNDDEDTGDDRRPRGGRSRRPDEAADDGLVIVVCYGGRSNGVHTTTHKIRYRLSPVPTFREGGWGDGWMGCRMGAVEEIHCSKFFKRNYLISISLIAVPHALFWPNI